MEKVKLYLNYAGHCFARENHAIQGGRNKEIKFHALWGLIDHPTKGYILFDTGYTDRFFAATANFPNKIYAMATKVVLNANEDVRSQLEEAGISTQDIKHIIVSHFHADHVGGLLDFPNATLYASRAALEQALYIPRILAFTRGILKSLLPHDLEERTQIIEETATAKDHDILGTTYDLFGDNTLRIVPLPGHAAGQVGVLLETEKNPYFLIADACWLKRSYTHLKMPHPIVKLFFQSWAKFKSSLRKVNRYHQQRPEVIVVPTHCEESTNPLISAELNLDAL
jgi:glyoxylase-like metal-dependent hydrolase (beta-lactamase superfamily II)